eukprot:11104108-Heterocapsa_arctica.AAC.1
MDSAKRMEDFELLKRFRVVEHQGHPWIHIITHTRKFFNNMFKRKLIAHMDWPVEGDEWVPALQAPAQAEGKGGWGAQAPAQSDGWADLVAGVPAPADAQTDGW